MSLLEIFIYISLINWSIISLLWFFSRNKDSDFLIKLYEGMGISILTLLLIIFTVILEDPGLNIRRNLINLLVILWGFIITYSIYKKPGFKKKKSKKINSFKGRYLNLGLMQVIVISPIISINFLPGMNYLNVLDLLGFSLFFIGFYLETKSNASLQAFEVKKDRDEHFLTSGPWSHCRHPNYFGHLLQWWAIYLVALSSVGGFWSFFGPLVLSVYFIKGPIAYKEELLKNNFREYGTYINQTNKLIPETFFSSNILINWLRSMVPFKKLTFFIGLICKIENRIVKNTLIELFCFFYQPNMEESISRDPKDFRSFNAFFTRRLKQDSRPICSSEDSFISPVDGTIVQLGALTEGVLIQAKGIKYNLKELLGEEDLEKIFYNGSYLTIYLAPYNYHRIHFPFDGRITKTKYIEGSLYSVNNKSTRRVESLYCRNERTLAYVTCNSLNYGLVSVGAAMVGSVVPFWDESSYSKKENFINSWNLGPQEELREIKKGNELGYFQMGSTVILLLPEGIDLDKNYLYESKPVKFGEELINLSNKK